MTLWRLRKGAAVWANLRTGGALPWVLLFAFYLFTLYRLHRGYLTKGLDYYDLGLISDFMSSVWHGRGFFQVFGSGVNHLAWLFTPTLILLSPLHWLCDSQLVTVYWHVTATFAGYAFMLASVRLLLERLRTGTPRKDASGLGALSPEAAWIWAGSLFTVLAATSGYCFQVNLTVHYESLYLLFASATLYALIRGAHLAVLLPLYVLCLGSRPDAGLFLAPQLATLFVILRSPQYDRPGGVPIRRIVLLAGGGVLYTLLVVTVISPTLGVAASTHAVRYWSHYGDSFTSVALHLLAHPSTLFHSAKEGGFLWLNQTLFLLPFCHIAGWIANLPGLLLYTTKDPFHQLVLGYNAALLLPGLFLGAFAGLETASRAVDCLVLMRTRATRLRAQNLALGFLLIGVLGVGMPRVVWPRHFRLLETLPWKVTPGEGRRQIAWIRDLFESCPAIRSVAADQSTASWIPNRIGLKLVSLGVEVDAVVYSSKIPVTPAFGGSLEQFEKWLVAHPGYEPFRETQGLKSFVRKGLCKR